MQSCKTLVECCGEEIKNGFILKRGISLFFLCVRKAEISVVNAAMYHLPKRSDPVQALTAFWLEALHVSLATAGNGSKKKGSEEQWKMEPRWCKSQFPGSASGDPRGGKKFKKAGWDSWGWRAKTICTNVRMSY